mmetsp:Transcript_23080/g.45413  ORF Transcript_23080/g.45413 Transcript_23080/m.45413 type:complete len:472 (+) Transcript_23080:493-1908(+)
MQEHSLCCKEGLRLQSQHPSSPSLNHSAELLLRQGFHLRKLCLQGAALPPPWSSLKRLQELLGRVCCLGQCPLPRVFHVFNLRPCQWRGLRSVPSHLQRPRRAWPWSRCRPVLLPPQVDRDVPQPSEAASVLLLLVQLIPPVRVGGLAGVQQGSVNPRHSVLKFRKLVNRSRLTELQHSGDPCRLSRLKLHLQDCVFEPHNILPSELCGRLFGPKLWRAPPLLEVFLRGPIGRQLVEDREVGVKRKADVVARTKLECAATVGCSHHRPDFFVVDKKLNLLAQIPHAVLVLVLQRLLVRSSPWSRVLLYQSLCARLSRDHTPHILLLHHVPLLHAVLPHPPFVVGLLLDEHLLLGAPVILTIPAQSKQRCSFHSFDSLLVAVTLLIVKVDRGDQLGLAGDFLLFFLSSLLPRLQFSQTLHVPRIVHRVLSSPHASLLPLLLQLPLLAFAFPPLVQMEWQLGLQKHLLQLLGC